MQTDKDKKYILNEFLRNISDISDKEYQKRVWIQGEGPEVNDFDETVCHFFDDGDPILNNYNNYEITDLQLDLLTRFRREFQDFCNNNFWPPEFIDTPEWENIMEMAKNVLKAFHYSKTETE